MLMQMRGFKEPRESRRFVGSFMDLLNTKRDVNLGFLPKRAIEHTHLDGVVDEL